MSISMRVPVLWLTIRQFRAGKAVLPVAFFSVVSLILAAIYLVGPGDITNRVFLSHIYLDLLAPTVVPLATLILASSALGNEIADHTLAYLVIKPIGRWRIVLEKYAGVAAVTGLFFLVGLTLTWGLLELASGGVDWTLLASLLLATASGILAYGALFLLVSLVIQRGLLVGILYIMLWESLIARVIPGIKILSVRHFTQSIFVQAISDPSIDLPDAIQAGRAAVLLVCLVLASLALAVFRLREMNLD